MSYPQPVFFLENSTDKHRIPVYQWQPVTGAKAIVHISHGMAEHSGRYQELANLLTSQGFIVYAHDHRGHGATITKADGISNQGHFGDRNDWDNVIHDLKHVVDSIISEHPGIPCFLLGHSMGSYILQSYLSRYSPDINGIILSGSNYVPKPLLTLGKAIARLEIWRQGTSGNSPVIHQMTFADYNRKFKPNITDFDWLSRDPESVQKYATDPLCGFACTNQLWADLFQGLQEICSLDTLAKIHQQLPIMIIGGDKDPVSAPNGLKRLEKAFTASGHENTLLKLYSGARHELFHEVNRQEIHGELIQWLENHL
ncbi:lysophospholipase [Endozoicomonas sp.]|uniref:alpha/beta hydrolase n=1 Tax=Endozoicomonas sp. TaxID=1892382 RepID=UPI00383ABF67